MVGAVEAAKEISSSEGPQALQLGAQVCPIKERLLRGNEVVRFAFHKDHSVSWTGVGLGSARRL